MGAILNRRARAAVIALALIAPSLAAAQGVPSANGALPTREEVTQPVVPVQPAAPKLRVEGDIERSTCPLADPAYKDIRVTITHATFNGLKGISEAELEPAWRSRAGENLPVAAICDIRDAVATVLRRKGYLAAVQVPTQQIENGEVRFEVLYARLTAIRVRGDAGRMERLVASYLEPLTRDEVFNQNKAERRLLLTRDLPGLDVRLALKPSGRPGEVYGEVTLVRTPVQADFNVQNFAARETGRFGAQARVLLNGLTGLGDQTLIGFYSTAEYREQRVLQLGHEFRAGNNGLTLAGRFSYAWTRPELPAAADVLKARTLFATGEARYPFRRRQASSLWGAAGLDYVNQSVRFAGVGIARDRLRVGYLRADGETIDGSAVPNWRLSYGAELRKGFSLFDATPRTLAIGGVASTRVDGDPRAALVRGNLTADTRLGSTLTMTINARAQHAFDPVLAFEEFSAGSYTIGRGYDPGTLLGDSGASGSVEFRLNGITPRRTRLTLQPFVFADAARVWNKGPGGDDQLASVGGGVRASLNDRFRLDVTLAVPVERAGLSTRRGDPRLLISFTTKLLPWGNK